MNTTNKSNRPAYDSKRALCVKAVAAEFKVDESYVRRIIRKNVVEVGKSEEIRRSYNTKYEAAVNIFG